VGVINRILRAITYSLEDQKIDIFGACVSGTAMHISSSWPEQT